jgi:hypothetical protein
MLPKPLRRVLVGVMVVSVILMYLSGATRFGSDREPEDWGLFIAAVVLFVGVFAVAFVAKWVLAAREGRRPSFRIDADTRRRVKTLPVVLVLGLLGGGIAILVGELF